MSKDVALLDYGSGNIRSAHRALAAVGASVTVTSEAAVALEQDALVVPGVGAFAACMQGLLAIDGRSVIDEFQASGRPILGICVGMQILFDRGVEHGEDTRGCGVLPGVVESLDAPIVPHMGWNTIDAAAGSKLFEGIADQRFYFVHSYAVKAAGAISEHRGMTTATYGEPFVAAVENGNLSATQFHPEKSGTAGLQLLNNWVATI